MSALALEMSIPRRHTLEVLQYHVALGGVGRKNAMALKETESNEEPSADAAPILIELGIDPNSVQYSIYAQT